MVQFLQTFKLGIHKDPKDTKGSHFDIITFLRELQSCMETNTRSQFFRQHAIFRNFYHVIMSLFLVF